MNEIEEAKRLALECRGMIKKAKNWNHVWKFRLRYSEIITDGQDCKLPDII